MARYNGRIVFIDGFAGPGRYSGGEEGSPLIAVRALLEHPHFRNGGTRSEVVFQFIEVDHARAEALKAEFVQLAKKKPWPKWMTVQTHEGEFADLMGKVLDDMDAEGDRLAPTFAFVDPFGFKGVPMKLVARIARNAKCEVLVNFVYEYVNRFLSHPDPAIQSHLTELFGTEDWRPIGSITDPEERRNQLVELYRRQLHDVAGLDYVRVFEMINEGNRTEYFLCFGTHSLEGLSKMKQAMWKADPSTGQVFSDRSDSSQLVLIQVGGEGGLGKRLQTRFRGRGSVSIEAVEKFVLVETPYSEKMHLKRKTLMPMEKASPAQIKVPRRPGTRNRPGDYPPGTLIKFL